LLMILLALAVILIVRTVGERTVLGTETHHHVGGSHA